jgi:cell volume regulation protein A
MSEIVAFGAIVLVVSTGFSLALLSGRLTERYSLPGPAIFLLAAAIAAEIFPRLGHELSPREIERVVTVALVLILFDGGMHVGLRRFRTAVVPIVSLGLLGTFLTAGAMALAAHLVFGFSWATCALLGAALAPTDPAAVFSVLGKRELVGRSATILEGESGANDPVGIALMLALLAHFGAGNESWGRAAVEFMLALAVGTAVGIVGGLAIAALLRRIEVPAEALLPLYTLALAGVIYGLAAVLHGSGFLAVFIAGIVVGDLPGLRERGIERFHASLAALAEIVAFVTLGLTVSLAGLGWDWLRGIVLALLLALVVRPLVVGPLLLPIRLRRAERVFVLWGGLKGAVPILLGTLVLLGRVSDGRRIYDLVFVVVAFSILVQGTTLPWLAARSGLTRPTED